MSTRTVLIGVLGFVIGVPVSLGLISFVARVNRIPELTTATLDSAPGTVASSVAAQRVRPIVFNKCEV